MECPLVLDLSDLFSADEQGIEAIRGLLLKGVEIRGASQFVRMLLEDEDRRPGASHSVDE